MMMEARLDEASEEAWPRDPFDYVIASRDREIGTLVADALARDRAQLAFQPVMTAAMPPRAAFHEGFIRLRDSQGRILPARSFISQVEDNALGRDIDCASLRLGLDMLARHSRLRLAINMSARSIGDGKWRQTLEDGLLATPDIGPRLILEITEASAMLLPEVVVRFMAELQPRGVCFSLDDFGAGLIAFRHLKDFLFDMVKIDSLFVRGIDTSPDNQALAAALVSVAHQFEMLTVAEGVETEGEARYLRKLGVDCLQGYLFGIPKATL
jgi:EAL domain-containing protein (putative c-di-GMP-specific phosphodiesterase class I)